MSKKERIIYLRAKAEAHLYVAVAKKDELITVNEKTTCNYYSQISKSLIDLLEIDEILSKKIYKEINIIINETKYLNSSSDDHLNLTINLLGEAKQLGDFTTHQVIDKHLQGLQVLAEKDGYLYKEAVFLKKIKNTLSKI